MTQLLVGSADVNNPGSWTTTPLWSKVNDPSDTGTPPSSYITKANNSTGACRVGTLVSTVGTLQDPGVHTGHILHIYCMRTGSRATTLAVTLYEGTTSRATFNASPASATYTEFTYTLTSTEAAAITNYANLNLDINCTASGSSNAPRVSCVWLEVPGNPLISVKTNLPAYIVGRDNIKGNTPAYTNGANPTIPASTAQPVYLNGQDTFKGSTYAYSAGWDTGKSNLASYLDGVALQPGVLAAFLSGLDTQKGSTYAFVVGQDTGKGNQVAYLEGSAGGGSGTASLAVWTIGLENPLIPDGYIGGSGIWRDETGGTSNIYQSIDEASPSDSDYICNVDQAIGSYYEMSLSNPVGTPGDGDVVVFFRGRDSTGLGHAQATIELRQGATVIASMQQVLSSMPVTYYFALTPAEKASITNWNDLRIRIIANIM